MIRARWAAALATLIGVLAAGAARAQEPPLEPWEPELVTETPQPPPALHGSPLASAALAAIDHYREVIGPRSIARCPFLCSCSAFARQAIATHGLVIGVLLFVDRFFYRENRALPAHYDPVIGEDGHLRWSDVAGASPAAPCR